jgi:hypothetical protein
VGGRDTGKIQCYGGFYRFRQEAGVNPEEVIEAVELREQLADLLEALQSEESLRAYYEEEVKRQQSLAPLPLQEDKTRQEDKQMDFSLSISAALLATAGLATLINPIAAGAAVGIFLASNRWLNR